MITAPVDQDQRSIATTEFQRNVIVLAGAGTGKTTILIDRLLLLLLGEEIPIEKIVALTFTKKAAEEMRERLEIQLRKILEDQVSTTFLDEKYSSSKDRWISLAKRALDQISRGHIGTIHHFAGHLLKLFPVQAKVDPHFKQDEGALANSLFEELWGQWISIELSAKSPRRKLWEEALSVYTLADLKQCARNLSSPYSTPENVKRKISLKKNAGLWLDELKSLCSLHPSSGKKTSFTAALELMEVVFLKTMQGEKVAEDVQLALEEISSLRFPKKEWDQDLSGKEQLSRLFKRAVALSMVDDEFINQALQIVSPFSQIFKSELNRKGILPLDSLLVRARDLLRDHQDVRLYLKRQFRSFLIDEFQDTDPIQSEILFYLTENEADFSKNWRAVKLAAGKLFVVGDPKQSIYRFRGADISAFEEVCELMQRQGAVQTTLSSNFRSHEKILDPINQIFSQLMEEVPRIQPPYLPLEPGIQTAPRPGLHQIDINVSEADGKVGSLQFQQCEAEIISEWISKNVGLESYNNRPLEYRDVAILFRSSFSFHSYLDALRKRNIPYLVEGEKTFYKRPEILLLYNLLSCIYNPNDSLALVGVLRSPLGALNDEEILNLKIKSGFSYLSSSTLYSDRLNPLYAELRSLHQLSRSLGVIDLIQAVFDQTSLMPLTLSSLHGEQSYANLLKCKDLAKKLNEEKPISLKEYLQNLKDDRESLTEEGENPLSDNQFNAVKVMTIHKAKGLEFPVVFLPNLSAGGNQKKYSHVSFRNDWATGLIGLRLPSLKKTNSAMFLLEEIESEKEKAEEIRIFYVAATRAKEKMFFITRPISRGKPPIAEMLKKSGFWPDQDQSNSDIPLQRVNWASYKPSKEKELPSTPLLADQQPSFLVEKLKVRESVYQKYAGSTFALAPSQLTQDDQKRWVSNEENSVGPENAIKIGLLCHKILELWDFKLKGNLIESALIKAVQKNVHFFDLIPGQPPHDAIITESTEILKNFFASDCYVTLSAKKIVGREIPFLNTIDSTVEGDSSLIRGVIDLVYEEGDKLIVSDFKTTKTREGEESLIASKYINQGKAYTTALKAATQKEIDFEIIFLRSSKAIRLKTE